LGGDRLLPGTARGRLDVGAGETGAFVSRAGSPAQSGVRSERRPRAGTLHGRTLHGRRARLMIAAAADKRERIVLSLAPEAAARLRAITGSGDFLPLVTMVSMAAVTLSRYVRKDSLTLATPPRVREDGTALKGVVPLRIDLDWEMSVQALLLAVRTTMLEA